MFFSAAILKTSQVLDLGLIIFTVSFLENNSGVNIMKRESAYKACMREAEVEDSDFFENVTEQRFKLITKGIHDKKRVFIHYLYYETAFKETTRSVCSTNYAEKWDLIKNIILKDIDVMFSVDVPTHNIIRLLPFISDIEYTKETNGKSITMKVCMKINRVNQQTLILFGSLGAKMAKKEGVWCCVEYWGINRY